MVSAKGLAWDILSDLSDRAGIPEWLGHKSDDAAQDVANEVAALIEPRFAEQRAAERAKIVAWLRRDGGDPAANDYADQIERSEHVK